jgi:hypothetical protein
MNSPVLLRTAASRRPASERARAVVSAASLRTGPVSSAAGPGSASTVSPDEGQSSSRAAYSSPPGHPVTGPNMGWPVTVRRWNPAGSLAPGNRQATPMIATGPP